MPLNTPSLAPLFLGAAVLLGAAASAHAGNGAFVLKSPKDGSQAFTNAINAKDLDKLTALYADDAVMVVDGGATVRGRKAIHDYFESAMPGLDHIELKTLFRLVAADTMLTRTLYTAYFKASDGTLNTVTASGNEVARKQADGSWLYVIDHHFGGSDLPTFEAMSHPHNAQ